MHSSLNFSNVLSFFFFRVLPFSKYFHAQTFIWTSQQSCESGRAKGHYLRLIGRQTCLENLYGLPLIKMSYSQQQNPCSSTPFHYTSLSLRSQCIKQDHINMIRNLKRSWNSCKPMRWGNGN